RSEPTLASVAGGAARALDLVDRACHRSLAVTVAEGIHVGLPGAARWSARPADRLSAMAAPYGGHGRGSIGNPAHSAGPAMPIGSRSAGGAILGRGPGGRWR